MKVLANNLKKVYRQYKMMEWRNRKKYKVTFTEETKR